MKITHLLPLLALFLSSWLPTAAQSHGDETLNLIPRALKVQPLSGHFVLQAPLSIVAHDKEGKAAAQYLLEKLQQSTPFAPQWASQEGKRGFISFLPTSLPHEAYVLEVKPEGIRIKAGGYAGYFYAVQSLLQLLPPEVEAQQSATQPTGWRISAVSIHDAPRFPYRGIMIDPCRHFLPIADIKRQIDILSTYKINRLHWHLTDDQGWRIEIKKYPQLTQKGAWRTEANGSQHGGFYTQDEIREVVEYAKSRAIEIVPELEIPGHELAAISALPHLSCRQEPTSPRIIWGVEEVVMCPGRETMFHFLQDVIDEMCELFPGRLFHIGGDEAPYHEWQQCKHCQNRMKALHYSSEKQLQGYIVERIAHYLEQKGKQAIGWDEVLEAGQLPASTVIMSWRGSKGGLEAAQAGHPVIMSPNSDGYYLDYLQGDLLTEPIAFSMYGDLNMTYHFAPYGKAQAQQASLFWGVQGNAWSEYIHNPQHLEYKIYPRALAIAEVGWTAQTKRDFSDFCRRLDGDAALRLHHRQVNFHIPMPQQMGERPDHWPSCNHLVFTSDSLSLPLTSTRPLPIVYTTDGSQPSARSPRYSSPLILREPCLVRTRCVLPCGLLGPERLIRVYQESPRPAQRSQPAQGGMRVCRAWGNYNYSNAAQAPFGADTLVQTIEDISRLTPLPRNMRQVRHYAAMGSFELEIDQEGIYEFSTHNAGLWVDDEWLVDNRMVYIPRNSPHSAQIALKAGIHTVRTLFVGGIFHGWPTYWDEGSIYMRSSGQSAWTRLKLPRSPNHLPPPHLPSSILLDSNGIFLISPTAPSSSSAFTPPSECIHAVLPKTSPKRREV